MIWVNSTKVVNSSFWENASSTYATNTSVYNLCLMQLLPHLPSVHVKDYRWPPGQTSVPWENKFGAEVLALLLYIFFLIIYYQIEIP